MTPTTLIHDGRVLRRRGSDYISDRADILIEGSTIREITASRPEDGLRHDTVIDASGKLIMPGLINAHTHSYGNLARGTFDALPLEAWVPYATAVTVRRTREEGYISAMLGIIECVRIGTTAVLDHLAGSIEAQEGALEAYRDAGLRVTMAPMVSDLPAHTTVKKDLEMPAELRRSVEALATPDRQEIIAGQKELFQHWHRKDGLVSISLGPSGPQRCSEELLLACGALANEFDTGIHTHLLESRAQQKYAYERYGKSMVAYLDDLGLLSSRLSGAHAVWCTEEDLKTIAGTGPVLVHNPWSNLTLGSGIAPLPQWHESGVVAALGTDGANCGGNQSMFRAMHLATTLHRSAANPVQDWITPSKILAQATEGSAQALHFDSKIGRLEPGFEADLVILDLSSSAYIPETDIINQLVLGESGEAVETVLIGGKSVLENKRMVGVDESKIFEAARTMLDDILARNSDLIEAAKLQEKFMREVSHGAHTP